MSCCRWRAHDSVEQSDVQREGRAARKRLHQPACRRTVEEKLVCHAHVVRRHHPRQSIREECHLANKRVVENLIDKIAVKRAAVRLAPYSRAIGRSESVHEKSVISTKRLNKCQSGSAGG